MLRLCASPKLVTHVPHRLLHRRNRVTAKIRVIRLQTEVGVTLSVLKSQIAVRSLVVADEIVEAVKIVVVAVIAQVTVIQRVHHDQRLLKLTPN
jgi:hypothetical protein